MRHRFNPRKRVNDYQRYSMLTVLPLRSMSRVPSAIHLRSKLQATTILAGITIHWALRRIFWKIFVYLMVTNVMMKTCLNKKIIKISNLIQAMKNSVCPKRMLCEGRIFPKPNFPKFPNRGFNTRHDNREVTLIEFLENRICPNIYRMFRSVDWTHDMIIVKVTLIHLTRAQTLRSDKCATGSIHANESMTINVIPC